jgi:hypothetical protein
MARRSTHPVRGPYCGSLNVMRTHPSCTCSAVAAVPAASVRSGTRVVSGRK